MLDFLKQSMYNQLGDYYIADQYLLEFLQEYGIENDNPKNYSVAFVFGDEEKTTVILRLFNSSSMMYYEEIFNI